MSLDVLSAYAGFAVLLWFGLWMGARGWRGQPSPRAKFIEKRLSEPPVRHTHFLDSMNAEIPRDLDLFCVEAFRKEPSKKYLDIIQQAYDEIPRDELPRLINRWQNSHRRLYLNYFRRYERSNDVQYLKTVLERFPKPVGLFLMNAGSGYVRQAAIEAWGHKCSVSELPFLLARLNDWVPAIRQVARKQVGRLSSRLSDDDTLLLLGNFYRLSLGERHEAEGLVRRIYSRVLRNEALLESVVSGRQSVLARQFLDLAWEEEGRRSHLLKWALNSACPVLRAQALNLSTGSDVSPEVKQSALEQFAKDGSPTVRKALFGLSRQVGGEQWPQLVAQSLWDPSRSVRHSAQFEAKSLFPEGFAAGIYSDALADEGLATSKKATAVYGCAEMGVTLDVGILKECLDSPANALRCALFSHDNVPAEWAWACFEPWRNCSLKVCRTAVEYLKTKSTFSAGEILDAFRKDKESKRRLAALGLIASLPYWERLYGCLLIWPELPCENRHQIQSILAGWLARTDIGARPGPELFARIKKEIERLERLDDPDLKLKEIKWAIKGWRLE